MYLPACRSNWLLLNGILSRIKVEELLGRKLAKETAEKELQEFIQLLYSAKARPLDAKLPRSSWISEDRIRDRIDALAAYAVDTFCSESQKRTAQTVICFT